MIVKDETVRQSAATCKSNMCEGQDMWLTSPEMCEINVMKFCSLREYGSNECKVHVEEHARKCKVYKVSPCAKVEVCVQKENCVQIVPIMFDLTANSISGVGGRGNSGYEGFSWLTAEGKKLLVWQWRPSGRRLNFGKTVLVPSCFGGVLCHAYQSAEAFFCGRTKRNSLWNSEMTVWGEQSQK